MASDALQGNAIFDLQSRSSSRAVCVDITVQVTCKRPVLRRIGLPFSPMYFYGHSLVATCSSRRIFLFSHMPVGSRCLPSNKSQISCCRSSFLSKFLLVANREYKTDREILITSHEFR